jgi:hypothetical protein
MILHNFLLIFNDCWNFENTAPEEENEVEERNININAQNLRLHVQATALEWDANQN